MAWPAKTGQHMGAFLPVFERGSGVWRSLVGWQSAGVPADLTSLERIRVIHHRAKLSKERTALQRSDQYVNRKQRKELARRLRSNNPGWEVVHRHAAGIDVGSEEHDVAMAPNQQEESVQRFGCFTGELLRMATWLKERGVRTVAMQSTGVYWMPLYDLLEEHGFEV